MTQSTRDRIKGILRANADLCAKDARRHWPLHLFHQAPLTHAARIINSGSILCRDEAIAQGVLVHDAASDEIIQGSARAGRYARLYFRPKTPTYYCWEGIRHPSEIERNAHCPVPITFRFNAEEVLVDPNVHFTGCSLARSSTVIHSEVRALEEYDWKSIFHDGAFSPTEKDRIIGARQAEVLMPTQLDLTHVVDVVTRSEPERRTLLRMLDAPTRAAWRDKIRVESIFDDNIYFRRWLFIEQVSYNGDQIHLTFGVRKVYSYRFDVKIFEPGETKPARTWNGEHQCLQALRLHVPDMSERVRVQVLIEGRLAFDAPISRQLVF